MKKTLLVLAILTAAPAVAMALSLRPPLTMDAVKVISFGEMPVDSGVLRTLRRMTVMDSDKATHDLWIVWLSKDQAVPHIGALCDLSYHEEWDSHPEGRNRSKVRRRVLDEFRCDTGTD